MSSKPWPIITDGLIGDVPTNFIPKKDSERGQILEGTMGLKTLCKLPDCTEIRGLFSFNGYLYAIAERLSQSVLWRIDTSSGGYSEIGTITTSNSGPVWIVSNYRDTGSQILIVDGVSGYVFVPSKNSFVQISDTNFPGALACSYQDTYGLFVTPDSQEWFYSDPNDFKTYTALNYYSKEGAPDFVKSILSDGVQILVFGEKSFETWYDAGGDNTSTSNPTFARNEGGVFFYGLASAGCECICDNTPIWLSDQGQLIRFASNVANIISTDMFGRSVKAMSSYADARAFSFIDKEHTYYQITFPSAGETWVYDVKTKLFHKRTSYLDDGSGWGRHRANCYALLDNKHWVGDYSNGTIYEMSSEYYDDDGYPIRGILYAQELDGGLSRIFFPEIQLLFIMGVGTEDGLDPQVMLQYSKDSGKTWSVERWGSIGKIGEYTKRAIWRLNGSDYKRLYRMIITDPVPRMVMGIDYERKSK